MDCNWKANLQQDLESKKEELTARLGRISENLRRGLAADSKERAKELEDREVVEALGNEARFELRRIDAVLERLNRGDFDRCTACGDPIGEGRFRAQPYATECISCAELDFRCVLKIQQNNFSTE